jgi:predicted regulator of Ras-like GTPase activity (Roadblock/LC7/MglB family)
MSPLASALRTLAARTDVAGIVVLSDEGLVVGADLPPGLEAETVAALAATALRALATLGTALGHGTATQVVLDAPEGSAILTRLASGTTVLVRASEGADLGDLLHALRQEAPALVDLT